MSIIIPIPKKQSDLLEQGKGGNYALYFSRMTQWRQSSGELKAEYLARVVQTKNGPHDEYAQDIERLGQKAERILQAASTTLEAIHSRQRDILQTEACRTGMVLEFRARLLSPFVSGLGSGHPTETGMILDRNSGLPYIPASSIKGVLRLAHALDIAEQDSTVLQENKGGEIVIDDREPSLRRYFGDTDTGKEDSVRGQLVFLDAFPADVPTIKTDIMNPHFRQYYAGGQGPLETENPNPVKFLAIAPGTECIFRCFAAPLPARDHNADSEVFRPFDDKDEQAIIAMFTRACAQLGFGGKTSIGYGRFTPVDTKTTEDFNYPWRALTRSLGPITDWGMLRQNCLEHNELQQYRAEREVGEWARAEAERVRTNFPKNWTAERDRQVAEWLAPSGVSWESGQQGPAEPSETLSPEEQRQVDSIRALNDWGQYKTESVTVEDLCLAATEALRERFAEWGVEKKAKNKEKKAAWNKLNAHWRKIK